MNNFKKCVECFYCCFAACVRITIFCCFIQYPLLIADRKTVSGLKSSCEAPDVIEGHMGRIVCTFEVDISKRLHDLEVQHFSDAIMNCNYINENITICHTNDGYQYEGNISNKLTIKMPQVKKDKAGQYSCVVAPSEPEEILPCNLNVTDPDFEETTSTSTDHFVYTTVTSSTGQERSVYGEYVYIILIVLGAALPLSSLIFAFLSLTRFTHKLDNWLKIRITDVICSGCIVEESPRELEETEACL